MRKLLIISTLLISLAFTSCSSDSGNSEQTEIEFDKTNFDFGKLPHKADAKVEFFFENKGTNPLIITNVTSSCGCTVPDYPKEALQPGQRASIKVKYDSNRVGVFHKSVKVFCNAANSPVKLEIGGEILSPKIDTNNIDSNKTPKSDDKNRKEMK